MVMIKQYKEMRMFSLKMRQLRLIVFFKYLRSFQTEETLNSFFDTEKERTKEGGGGEVSRRQVSAPFKDNCHFQ